MNPAAYTLVFGLTADPIHKGHEQVIHNSFAFAKQQQLNISQFLLVPTYQPNLIAGKQQPRTAFQHRFTMCQLLAEHMNQQFNYRVQVSDIEEQLFKKNQQKSYSYDTLKAIKAEHKLFVLSADHFAGRWPKFRKWYQWQALVKANGLLIHQRPGHRINHSFIQQLKDINPAVFVVKDYPSVAVSSTQLRQALSQQQTIPDTLLSPVISHYLEPLNLY